MSIQKRKLAIFDIDGTVFRSSLLIEAFNALIDEGIFPKSADTEVRRDYEAWLDRKGHYDDYIMKLVRVYYRLLKGKRADRVETTIDSAIRAQKDRTYRYTRNLQHDLKKKGFLLVALSNSQDTTVQSFASVAGFDLAIGRPIEVLDGVYTGHGVVNGKRFPVDMKLNKPRLLNDFLATKGIVPDFKRSLAIGDSEGDREILDVVGTAIAFNPSYELAVLARRKKWKIVIERKDVMYHIDKAKFVVAERPREKAKM